MTTFSSSDDLQKAEFRDTDLSGARFVGTDLSGVVMRGVDVTGAEIDAPWLLEGGVDGTLTVNGVNVAPLVEAELNRRFPGRAQRYAAGADELRAAWAALQTAWTAAVDRAAAMPPGTVDVSVDGEWTFAQTLRHLVLATDTWLGLSILEIEQPYHPLGMADAGFGEEHDMSVFTTEEPSYTDVLAARADRVAMVGDFLATVTPEVLAEPRKNPHQPDAQETVRSSLHVILEEEWEHLRFATRDLDAIAQDTP